ncbi:tRNA (guanine(26)-N(2))-dimethyltransferase [Candidatus Woesearchaeota archaeon]|nr:tRNA (guanine(26)-N(2))-dimethyltransferase [Candidatus Woesearchaeota archaeon]MBW3021794.1 tRNA (guanine(26)-N(2))-dimethyltransferase [Candidatus Woesearchaeota archaeon]
MVAEGKAVIDVEEGKICKDLLVFYNPDMKLNRDISVLLLNAVDDLRLRIALPLAGSGVRGIRFLLELVDDKLSEIHFNDGDIVAVNNIKSNLKLSKIQTNEKIKITNKEANKFLLESTGFNYIDIDPFGSPNPYLDAAAKRISRNGILALTATDTAPLCGTYPKTCLRKYWANPLKNELMHEAGLRILIRKVQLIGAQYEKALVPLLSYWNLHYFRVFFRCLKGKKGVDEILKLHGCYNEAGPMWLGSLFDKDLMMKVESGNDFVQLLKRESQIDVPFFFDMHLVCKKERIKIPKKESIIKKINEKGYKVTNTHFNLHALKTDMSYDEFVSLLKSLQ